MSELVEKQEHDIEQGVNPEEQNESAGERPNNKSRVEKHHHKHKYANKHRNKKHMRHEKRGTTKKSPLAETSQAGRRDTGDGAAAHHRKDNEQQLDNMSKKRYGPRHEDSRNDITTARPYFPVRRNLSSKGTDEKSKQTL